LVAFQTSGKPYRGQATCWRCWPGSCRQLVDRRWIYEYDAWAEAAAVT